MEHPNILNIEGVAPHLFPFCMVSDWMENGNMLEYVKNNPDADRFGLVGLTHWRFGLPLIGSQLLGVTRGLGYLHSNEVVHGDLKGVRWIHPPLPRLTTLPRKTLSSIRSAIPVSQISVSLRSRETSPRQMPRPPTVVARSITAPPNFSVTQRS